MNYIYMYSDYSECSTVECPVYAWSPIVSNPDPSYFRSAKWITPRAGDRDPALRK